MNDSVFAKTTQQLKAGQPQRFIALTNNGGATFPVMYYWFEIFSKVIRRQYGQQHFFLNTSYYKNTSILLEKFDSDFTFFQPTVAVVLIGGTEMDGPDNKFMPLTTTAQNLREIHRRLKGIGCDAIFMTYYQLDVDNVDASFMQHFCDSMDTVRSVAAETGSGLIDHLQRWSLLRAAFPRTHQLLMHDALHPNDRGYMLMGLDMARYFDVAVPTGIGTEIDDALATQALIDNLEK